MNIGFYNLILKRNISQNERNYQSKKLFKVRKMNMTVKDKRPLLLFIEKVFDSSVISFVFYF